MKSLRVPPLRSLLGRRCCVGGALVSMLLLSGCEMANHVATYRAHPEFRARVGQGPRLAAPADIAIREVGAGGVAEKIDEYSEEAARMFAARLGSEGDGEPAWRALDVPDEQREEYDEAVALARTVLGDMLAFSYATQYPGFDHKRASFRYSIGDISALVGDSGADTVLFLFGDDRYTTAGRKAVNGIMMVMAAAATGQVYLSNEGAGWVGAMLVDREGEVLWMDLFTDLGLDLRQQAEVDRVVAYFLEDLRRARSEIAPAVAAK